MKEEPKKAQSAYEWSADVPIFRDRIIMTQLGIALGIPFGLLAGILVAVSGVGNKDILYALGLLAALFGLGFLFIMVVYRGRYEVEFKLDDKGILCRTRAGQAQKNKIINAATVVLGLLGGKLTVAGAGLLAQGRQSVFIPWDRVSKVRYVPRQQVVLLWGGRLEQVALFCSRRNYDVVEALVKSRVTLPEEPQNPNNLPQKKKKDFLSSL